jgi:hypothetical protein
VNGSIFQRGLHVQSSVAAGQVRVESTAPDGNPSITIANDATSWHLQTVGARGDALEIMHSQSGGQEFHINTDGNVGIGTTTPTQRLHVVGNILATGSITPGSSRGFKDNIAPLTDVEASEAFWALEPVRFTYKADDSGDLQLGFIAEDVPELVAMPDRKGVGPMDLIAVLTKVVQQQQARIEALEKRLGTLETVRQNWN